MAAATALAEPTSTTPSRPRPGAPAPAGRSRDPLLRLLLNAIEVSSEDVTCCVHCGGTDLGRWGESRRALQRWRCRACERSCTAATGTALARVHSLDKLRAVAEDMLAEVPASCRKLAACLGLDRMTVWRWRKLIAAVWADDELALDTAAVGSAASATVSLRESRKASREWVRHQRDPQRYPAPDRLRWIDYRALDVPLPEPRARYRVVIRLDALFPHEVDDRAAGAACLGPVDAPPRQPKASPTCSAPAGRRSSVDGPAGTGCRARPPRSAADRPSAGHTGRAISVVEPFRHFMKPFRGPATAHLQTYHAWFLARLLAAAQS